MNISATVPIPYRIVALMHERNRLFAYSMKRLGGEIKATGFRCTRCGKCCTKAVNPAIFLLDHDVSEALMIDPAAIVPAPDPEFCDQNGTLYVSGYSVRMRNDAAGSCWFLDGNNCRIYDRRFSVCRIYPYLLRRSAGADGEVVWTKFSRLNNHGRYSQEFPDDECLALAREIKEYENAFLSQQISFLETVHEYFSVQDLWHDPEMYNRQVTRLRIGEPVTVKVYHGGELKEHRISRK